MTASAATKSSVSLDMTTISTGVEMGEDAIWYARSRTEISHPEEYQDWYLSVEDQSYWFRHRAQCIVTCLKRFPPQEPLFDVGGGNGHVSLAMQQAGHQPVLLEPSPGAVANASRRGLKNIICSTLDEAGLKPACIGSVGLFDVLEHVEDEGDFLKQLREVLKTGGRLYLTVPAFGWLWSWHDREVGHYRRYTLRGLSARLQAAGFEIDLASYLFAPLPLPIFLLRSLPWRLRLAQRNSRRNFQREHATSGGLASRAIEALLGCEKNHFAKGHTVPFGSSCLVVARAD